MFRTRAQIPGKHPRLEGSGATSRVMKIGSVAEANAQRPGIERVVRAWCAWRDAEAGGEKRRGPSRDENGGQEANGWREGLAANKRRR
jgi:hypothetical protein